MIFGYPVKQANEYGLMELREISIAGPPDLLRDLARFFSEMAEFMEQGGFEDCSHRHIGSVVLDWNKRFPNLEIVVAPPLATDASRQGVQ